MEPVDIEYEVFLGSEVPPDFIIETELAFLENTILDAYQNNPISHPMHQSFGELEYKLKVEAKNLQDNSLYLLYYFDMYFSRDPEDFNLIPLIKLGGEEMDEAWKWLCIERDTDDSKRLELIFKAAVTFCHQDPHD